MLWPVVSAEHIIFFGGVGGGGGQLLSEHTCLLNTETYLVVMEQDRTDKHSVFWAKPVWLCGLDGVTRVFPVSLHPKAFC